MSYNTLLAPSSEGLATTLDGRPSQPQDPIYTDRDAFMATLRSAIVGSIVRVCHLPLEMHPAADTSTTVGMMAIFLDHSAPSATQTHVGTIHKDYSLHRYGNADHYRITNEHPNTLIYPFDYQVGDESYPNPLLPPLSQEDRNLNFNLLEWLSRIYINTLDEIKRHRFQMPSIASVLDEPDFDENIGTYPLELANTIVHGYDTQDGAIHFDGMQPRQAREIIVAQAKLLGGNGEQRIRQVLPFFMTALYGPQGFAEFYIEDLFCKSKEMRPELIERSRRLAESLKRNFEAVRDGHLHMDVQLDTELVVIVMDAFRKEYGSDLTPQRLAAALRGERNGVFMDDADKNDAIDRIIRSVPTADFVTDRLFHNELTMKSADGLLIRSIMTMFGYRGVDLETSFELAVLMDERKVIEMAEMITERFPSPRMFDEAVEKLLLGQAGAGTDENQELAAMFLEYYKRYLQTHAIHRIYGSLERGGAYIQLRDIKLKL